MVFVAAFVPVTVKTEQLINRENFKINYGYNPTLDPDTDNAENKAVPRVSPGEHVPDIQSDGNKAKTWKIHAELVEWLYRGNGAIGGGKGREKCPLPPRTSAPFDLFATCKSTVSVSQSSKSAKGDGDASDEGRWQQHSLGLLGTAPPPRTKGGHTKASYQHSLA